MLLLRKIFFYLFALIYLVFCPLIILYALGFVVSPDQRRIVRTGVLSLSTLPPGASITLNKRPLSDKTPVVIHNVAPGRYSVTLQLAGYKAWEKEFFIKPRQAAKLEHVLLTPEQWPEKIVSDMEFKNILAPEGNPFVLVQKGPLIDDIYIHRIQQGLDSNFFSNIVKGRPSMFSNRPWSRSQRAAGFETNGSGRLMPVATDAVKRRPPLSAGQNNKPASQLNSESDAVFLQSMPALTPLFSHDFIYTGSRVLSSYTRPESPYLLILVEINNKKKFLWIDLKDKKPLVNDITDLFLKVPQDVRWDPQLGRDLLIYQDGSIDRLDTIEKAIFPKLAENICGFEISGNKIYVLRNNYVLEKLDFDGKALMIFRKGHKTFPSFLGNKNQVRLSLVKNDLLLVMGKRGELLLSRYPFGIVTHGVQGTAYHKDSDQLLIWTQDKIGILDLDDQKTGQRGFLLRWIMDRGNNIRQAFWVNHGRQILFSDQEQVYLLDPNPFFPAIPEEITRIKKNTQIHYDEDSGGLFFLNANQSQLSEIQILPVLGIIPFANPLNEPLKENHDI